MGIPSSYPDYNCKKCGILIKKGDLVNKIEATGQWCSNEKCPTPPGIPQSMMPEDSDLPISAKLKKFTKEEAGKLITIETEVKEIIPKAVDAKVGMYVKEIYRSWTNKEASA